MKNDIFIGIVDPFSHSYTEDIFIDDSKYTIFFPENKDSVLNWVKNETIDILITPSHYAMMTDSFIEEIRKLNSRVEIFFVASNFIDSQYKNSSRILKGIDFYPSISRAFEGNLDTLIKRIHLSYKNRIIEKSSKIIYDNKSLLISDIKIVNTEWSKIIKSKPELIHSLSARQFEEFIAEIWSNRGYTVELTPRTKDGGKDIYAYKKAFDCEFLFAIECKKYSLDHKVGRPVLQQLNGIIESERLTGGILATTSYFSKEAIKYIEPLKNRLFLNDIKILTEIITNEL